MWSGILAQDGNQWRKLVIAVSIEFDRLDRFVDDCVFVILFCFVVTRVGQIWFTLYKQKKNIDLFSETEFVTFQHNLPGLRFTCASGPEACGCRSGRSLLVASVATAEHPVSLPHYYNTFFRPDTPLGGRRCDSLRKQVPDSMEDVVERSISVSRWCPWCEQPRVDARCPGEMKLMFAPFFSCSWWLYFTLPSLMLSIPDNSLTVIRLFSRMSASTRSLFSPVTEVLSRRSRGSFSHSSFFKRTVPLTDTNNWRCLLTILSLQSWTDFRRFTAFSRQEFDYNALFHANV